MIIAIAAVLAVALILVLIRISRLQVTVAEQTARAESLEQTLETARDEAAREREARVASEIVTQDLKQLRSDIQAAREKSEEASQQSEEARKAAEREGGRATEAVQRLVSRYTRPKGRGQLSEAWLAGILEGVGLREGVNFDRERRVAIEKPNGESAIGVIDYYLWLPGGSGIALDAKYPFARAEDLVSDSDVLRKKARDDLRSSLRAHIKGLAERRYQDATDCQVDAVFLVLPSWEDHALARSVAPDLWEYAQRARVSIVPADGIFEIAEAVGLVHRLADTSGKIAYLHDPVIVGRMYDSSLAVLDALIRAVESHNAHGNRLAAVAKPFAPTGKFRHDVLDVLADAANRGDDGREVAEVKELPAYPARKHRNHLAERAEETKNQQSA